MLEEGRETDYDQEDDQDCKRRDAHSQYFSVRSRLIGAGFQAVEKLFARRGALYVFFPFRPALFLAVADIGL